MKNKLLLLVLIGSLTILSTQFVFAEYLYPDFEFNLVLPDGTITSSGAVTGLAGETVGWGYRIDNNSSYYILPVGLSASSFLYSEPNPFLNPLFDSQIIGPSLTVTQNWSMGVSGLYETRFFSSVVEGDFEYGLFLLTLEFYDGDPFDSTNPGVKIMEFTNSTGGTQSGDITAHTEYFAIVGPTAVPEPSSLLLIGTGLLGLVGLRKNFQIHSLSRKET